MSTDVPASIDPSTLPDDPALLKRMLVERDALVQRIREEAAEQLESQRQRLEAEKKAEIKAAVEAILRRFYGPKSERFDVRQLLLFGQKVEQLPLDETSIGEEASEKLATRRITKKHKHGRNPLPDHLPRIDIEHDLSDDEKKCPCCGEARCRLARR